MLFKYLDSNVQVCDECFKSFMATAHIVYAKYGTFCSSECYVAFNEALMDVQVYVSLRPGEEPDVMG